MTQAKTTEAEAYKAYEAAKAAQDQAYRAYQAAETAYETAQDQAAEAVEAYETAEKAYEAAQDQAAEAAEAYETAYEIAKEETAKAEAAQAEAKEETAKAEAAEAVESAPAETPKPAAPDFWDYMTPIMRAGFFDGLSEFSRRVFDDTTALQITQDYHAGYRIGQRAYTGMSKQGGF